MNVREVIDVSGLPSHALSHRAVTWWGILVMVAIEGTVVAILVAVYFYLFQNYHHWPPPRTPLPDLGPGTAQTAVLLLTVPVVLWMDRLVLHGGTKRSVMIALGIYFVLAGISIYIRILEFHGLHCDWDQHAYGSIVWWIMGLHFGHILASTVETLVLAIYIAIHKLDMKRRLDLNVDGLYWYFVVGSWIPLYVLIYWVPRWL